MAIAKAAVLRLEINSGCAIFAVDMSKKECIQGFSDYIFWDVDRQSIDPVVHAPYIVQRVLEYGQYSDWKHLL
ncbi:MAG: hypothetical protein IJ726_09580, partial [Phocaeicola sp.]|nr:hypothetical protein [Phocaeicola sp.]